MRVVIPLQATIYFIYSIYLFAFSDSALTPRSDLSDALTLSLLFMTGQELFFIVNDNLGQSPHARTSPIPRSGLLGLSKPDQKYAHLGNLQRGACDGVLGLRF